MREVNTFRNIKAIIIAVIIKSVVSINIKIGSNDKTVFEQGELYEFEYENKNLEDIIEFNIQIKPFDKVEDFEEMCFLLLVSGNQLKLSEFIQDINAVENSKFDKYAKKETVEIIDVDFEGLSSAKKTLTLNIKRDLAKKFQKLYFYVFGPYQFGKSEVMKTKNNKPTKFQGIYNLNNKMTCSNQCNESKSQGHCSYEGQLTYCRCNFGYIDRDCGIQAKQLKIGEDSVLVDVEEDQKTYLYFDITQDQSEEGGTLIIDVQFNTKTKGIIFKQTVNLNYQLWLYERDVLNPPGKITDDSQKYSLDLKDYIAGTRVVFMVLAEDDTQLEISLNRFEEESVDASMLILYIILGVLGFIVLLYIIYIVKRTKRLRRENHQLGQNIILLQAQNSSRARQQQQQKLTIEQIEEYMPSIIYSTHHKNTLNNDQCAVCLEEFAINKDKVRSTMCQHVFHSDCLGEWLKKQQNCPFCRQELTLERLKEYKLNPQSYLQINAIKLKQELVQNPSPQINPHDPQQEVLNKKDSKVDISNEEINILISEGNQQIQEKIQQQPEQKNQEQNHQIQ